MGRSRRSALVFFACAAWLAAACSEAVPGPSGGAPAVEASPQKLACAAPRRLLRTPSPFAEALLTWSAAPVGSTPALSAMEAACEAATREEARDTEYAACTLLGLAYASGEGVARDPGKAFAYLERGARCGFDFDAHDLAQARTRAIKSFGVACCAGRSCEGGCESECAAALEKVRSEVEPPLRAACARGSGVGCFMLALLARERGQYIQEVGAVIASGATAHEPLVESACRAGVGPACERHAWLVPEDAPGDAREKSLQRACDLGWGSACHHIGQQLDQRGARAAAVPYWERACGLGLPKVCDDLGDILSHGEGVPADRERAVKAYANGWR